MSGANGPPILTLENLSKHFGGVRAVDDVSFDVSTGIVTSLIGPNGAGKTTVFNLITGLYEPTAGSILFHGSKSSIDLAKPVFDSFHAAVLCAGTLGLGALAFAVPPLARWLYYRPRHPDSVARLGVARTFQNIRLFTDLSALDNVKVGLHARVKSGALDSVLRSPRHNREERSVAAAAMRYLEFVGLKDRAWEDADELAYGEQRRLEIARALATNPTLLLLDEPAAGMNATETNELIDLIGKIAEAGVTVFLIEHDMKLVMEISDRIVVLDYGRKIGEGEPQEVRSNPDVIAAYLGA